MKKLRLSIIALLFTCSLFSISPVKADPGEPCGGIDPDSGCGGGSDSGAPGLPIDGYVWVLVGAAGLIGMRIIARKTREESASVR
jgi:hypothetical protein